VIAKYIVLGSIMVLCTGCGVTQKLVKVEPDQKVEAFFEKTNLVQSHDRYWVKEIPETASAIGSTYRKVSENVNGSTYVAFVLEGNNLYKNIGDSNLNKENLTYSKDYAFKRSDKATLSAAAVFSAGYSDVSEVKKKVELKQVWSPKANDLEINSAYCKLDNYYVTRIYFGSSSDFGLKDVKYVATLAGIEVGGEVSAAESSTLHVIRDGVLAIMLQPTMSHPKCPSVAGFDDESTKKKLSPVAMSLEQELIQEGYVKHK